jgi:glutamine synthetase
VLCDVETPDGGPFPADPRAALARAVAAAAEAGFTYHVASEVEFYLFRSAGGAGGASGATAPAGGHRMHGGPADHGGYFDLAADEGHVREEIVQALGRLGVPVEASHHEIGPGQHEIDVPLLPAVAAADAVVTCKYVAKVVARRRGLLATFMPKPMADAAGSGLHLLQALRDGHGRDVFAEPTDEWGLSAAGRAFIAGQLAHARAMCAVLAPSVNSYRRIGRGFDAPSYLTWGRANPLAVIRVPRATWLPRAVREAPPDAPPGPPWRSNGGQAAPSRPASTQVELRCPDPSCNPYLALAVAIAAGLDGIRGAMTPPAPAGGTTGTPLDDLQVELLPASLAEAIQELEWDPVVRDALGAPVYERLLLSKEQEWEAYRRHVSTWEVERYLETS